MAISWLPEYSVGIKEIDDQHKKLVDMITTLEKAITANDTKSLLLQVISKLAEYTVYHFDTEERYFDQFNYEHTKEHKAQHKELVDKVVEIKTKVNTDEITLSFELIDYLEDWLIEHIMGADKMYTELFIKNGLS